ncbi:two-component system sensor histidine kinase NtrB [Halorhodospira neutriphila]|uniref:histidine kinase n=1 Tax=Halorhodospira neutriphila TaxID=168379 RepID=A0ABS1E447_9GAMM|nr:ATP-binding protein [Halorhodospira neutriphila]MBK1725872.1 hypothetical protein [Halorhodospira neutriphila]
MDDRPRWLPRSAALRLGTTFLAVTLLVALPLTLWFDHFARGVIESSLEQAAASPEAAAALLASPRLQQGFEAVRTAAMLTVVGSSLIAAGIGAGIAVRWRNRLRRIVERGRRRASRVPPASPPQACRNAAAGRHADELEEVEAQLLTTLDQLSRSQWLLDSVDDMVVLADHRGTIRHGNAAVGSRCACCPATTCQGTPTSVADVLGTSLWWRIRSGLEQGEPGTLEQEITLGGRRFPALIAYRPQQEVVVIKVTDLTEYRRLKEHVEKLEALSTLGQMSTELAHEIKNNIAPVRLLCGMAPLEPDDRDAVFRSLDHIRQLVNDFMAFGSGRQTEGLSVRLDEAVEAWTNVLRSEADAKGVAIALDVAPQPVRLPGGFRIVYANLVRNAVQAVAEGGHVRVSAALDPAGALTLRVADDGPGIPASIRQRLFEPFTTSRADGTGLGLALVQRYLDDAGGQIACDSQPGAGTTFTVYCPGVAEAETSAGLASAGVAP